MRQKEEPSEWDERHRRVRAGLAVGCEGSGERVRAANEFQVEGKKEEVRRTCVSFTRNDHLRAIAEAAEKFFAVLPAQAELGDIGES